MNRIIVFTLLSIIISSSALAQTYFGEQQFIINSECNRLISIFCTDLDGDGDNDVLYSSSQYDKIAWYENDG